MKDTMTDEEFDPADLPVRIYQSMAGYYIGQMEPGGAPYSRLSDCYYRTREEADKALAIGFPTGRMENEELESALVKKGKLVKR
jgi:hypothetical protein